VAYSDTYTESGKTVNDIILKFFGAAVLLAASFFLGASMIRDERGKIDEACSILDLIKYIKDNIEHFVKPLPDIFASYNNSVLEKNGFLTSVRENGIHLTAEKIEDYFHTDSELLSIFGDFCRSIGGGYKDDEVRLCSYTANQIEKRIEKMRDDYSSRSKLYRTIPPLFALSVVLILV